MTPDVPDNIGDPMPPMTYCKCAESWVSMETPLPPYVQVSLRIRCPACGHWTDAVPVSEK